MYKFQYYLAGVLAVFCAFLAINSADGFGWGTAAIANLHLFFLYSKAINNASTKRA